MSSLAPSSTSQNGAAFDSNMAPPPQISSRTIEQLCDSVESNLVTIVVGPTGSGKSTQVPQILLDRMGNGRGNGRILSTQPRRLAVVAVASRVAAERNVTLGGPEVGYHVGQSKHALSTTKLLFVTAGMFLEHLCSLGVKELTQYQAILIDECHERSPESDLVLSMLRSLLFKYGTTKPIRIVLMSATFDSTRYQRYFQNTAVGIDRIPIINLETATSFETFHDRVKVHYLDDVFQQFPYMARRHAEFRDIIRVNPNEDLTASTGLEIDGSKSLSDRLLNFILDLVQELHLQEEESNPTGVFVIFAPTYRYLEQIYNSLRKHQPKAPLFTWKAAVLHSSVDVEHCMRTIRMDDNRAEQDSSTDIAHTPAPRKIILASAIADSSITIPNVSVVIDLCRALEVKWDLTTRRHKARTVWASQSICDQRKGRTGRTCSGRVFRLVPRGFYIAQLPPFETAQLTLSSCRDEVLKVICSGKLIQGSNTNNSNSQTNPSLQLLEQCLDPPNEKVLDEALEYLKNIGACVMIRRRQQLIPEPSIFGKLCMSLSFPVEDAFLIVMGGQMGLLHEMLALRAIATHKPMPIVHSFGEESRNYAFLLKFNPKCKHNDPISVLMSNLAAFWYWDQHWNGSTCRQAILTQFASRSTASTMNEVEAIRANNGNVEGIDAAPTSSQYNNSSMNKPCCNAGRWSQEMEDKHLEWCEEVGINATAVQSIADLINQSIHVLYRSEYEPVWLRCTHPTPMWKHKRQEQSVEKRYAMFENETYGEHQGKSLMDVLKVLCDSPAKAVEYAKQMKRLAMTSATSANIQSSSPMRLPLLPKPERPYERTACIAYLKGYCSYTADKCRFKHDVNAPRPVCSYFQRGLCLKGELCLYYHESRDDMPSLLVNDPTQHLMDPVAPVLHSLELRGGVSSWFVERFPSNSLMLLKDSNFAFTQSLIRMNHSPRFVSDYSATNDDASTMREMGSITFMYVNPSRIHLNAHILNLLQTGEIKSFVYMFPSTESEDDDGSQESLIFAVFLSITLAISIARPTGSSISLGMALESDQFCRWNGLKNAIRMGWDLQAWGPFDVRDFTSYKPRSHDGEDVISPKDERFYHFSYQF